MTSLFEHARARGKLLIGVVHLLPLPGSSRFATRAGVMSRAFADAGRLLEGGLDGFIVENFGDAPFYRERVPSSTIAEMAVIGERLRRSMGDEMLLGVNVLRNDAGAALAVAAAIGGDFIRVNVHTGVMIADQGTLQGAAHETLRERRALEAKVEILADVAVKHALPPAGFSLEQAAKDTAYRGLADGLIVTGRGTGEAADSVELATVRAAVPDRLLLVGSGTTPENVEALLASADGVIVGTWVKEGGRVESPVSVDRVRELVRAARP